MLTIEQIARSVGVTPRTVYKRLPEISQYLAEAISTGGRPQKLYRDEVLQVFGVAVQPADQGRKSRSDRGKSRKYSDEAIERWVDIAEAMVLSMGEYNAYFAAERAVEQLYDEMPEQAELIRSKFWYCYKRFILTEFKNRKTEQYWLQRNQQHKSALQSVQIRYDMAQMLENANIAGAGFGFGRMLMLDDRVAKIRVAQDESFVQHTGVYVWCVLTGALLHVETVPTGSGVNTQSYCRALLCTIFAHAVPKNPIVFLENASSASAMRLENLIADLWDEESLQQHRENPTLRAAFGGQTGPVYRNLPHLPTAFGKATGEAFMKTILKRHDALYREQFSRVSLQVSNQPWLLVKSPNRQLEKLSKNGLMQFSEYANSVMEWFWNVRRYDRVQSLINWGKRHNLEPTRDNIIRYYSGAEITEAKSLALHRIGRIIYHATPTRLYHTAKTPGQFTATLDGNRVHLVVPGLTIEHIGELCVAIPNPLADSEWLVYVVESESDMPIVFLGIGTNAHATTFEQAAFLRQTVSSERKRQREIIETGLREKLSKLQAFGIDADDTPKIPKHENSPALPEPEQVVVVHNPTVVQQEQPIKPATPVQDDEDDWDDDVFAAL